MSAALDRLIAQKATRSGRKPPSRPIEVKVDFIDERSAGHLASLNRAYEWPNDAAASVGMKIIGIAARAN